jgi:hypothetical protein
MWHFFCGWLISMFVFDILHIPSGCIQICSGCIAPTCTPWLRACLHNRLTGCLRTDSLLVILRNKSPMLVFRFSDRFAIAVKQKAEFMLYAAAVSFFIQQINKHRM